jgi:hypothetical protein
VITRIEAVDAVRALHVAGLTVLEIAERMGAHPQAIKALQA